MTSQPVDCRPEDSRDFRAVKLRIVCETSEPFSELGRGQIQVMLSQQG